MVVTKEFILEAAYLQVHASVELTGNMTVELVREGLSVATSLPILAAQAQQEHRDLPVRWSEGTSLHSFVGSGVTLRIHMSHARLYALQFRHTG